MPKKGANGENMNPREEARRRIQVVSHAEKQVFRAELKKILGEETSPFAVSTAAEATPPRSVQANGGAEVPIQREATPPVLSEALSSVRVASESEREVAEKVPEAVSLPEIEGGEREMVFVLGRAVKDAALTKKIYEARHGKDGLNENMRAFAEKDYKDTKSWSNIAKVFSNLRGKREENSELLEYRAWMENKRVDVQNLELEAIKQFGLSPDEQKAFMIEYVASEKFEWNEELDDLRREVRHKELHREPLLEKINGLWAEAKKGVDQASWKERIGVYARLAQGGARVLGTEGMEAAKKLGKAVNEFSRTKTGKAIMVGAVGGAGAVGLGIATGGVATAIMAAVIARRGLAGFGVAAVAEAGGDWAAKKLRERKSKKEATKEVEGKSIEELQRYLKEQVIFKTGDELEKRKLGTLLRSLGAVSAGAVIGSGALSEVFKWMSSTGTGVSEKIVDDGIGGKTVPLQDTPSREFGKQMIGTGVPTQDISAGTKEVGQAITPDAKEGSLLLKSFTHEHIGKGESLWKFGVALGEKQGLSNPEQNALAKKIADALHAKIASGALSPKDLEAAGFMNSKSVPIDQLWLKADMKFDPSKILSNAELEKMIADAKAGALSTHGTLVIDQAQGPHPTGESIKKPLYPTSELLEPTETGKTEIVTKALGGEEHVVAMSDKATEAATAESPQTLPVKETLAPSGLSPEESGQKNFFKTLDNRLSEQAPLKIPPREGGVAQTTIEVAPVTPENISSEVRMIRSDGQLAKYLYSLPENAQKSVNVKFDYISHQLLDTDIMGDLDGDMKPGQFNPSADPAIWRAEVTTILQHKNWGTTDQNPLKSSQFRRLEQLILWAHRLFQEAGDPYPATATTKGETLRSYLIRISALADHEKIDLRNSLWLISKGERL